MIVPQANIDLAIANFKARLGQPYEYGGDWSPNPADETDCSGLVGETLEALTEGLKMPWGHPVSTESWPYDYATNTPAPPGTVGPFGTVAVASPADFPANAIATVAIHHGGGGADSHMNVSVIGYGLMEDNGDAGVCHDVPPAIAQTDSYWTDWWYLPGEVGNVTQGLDYAGGVIAGADIIAAGYSFACRYLAPGGASLPAKQLQPSEAANLTASGVGIVSNWESTGIDAEQGFSAGVGDAQAAQAQHALCGAPDDRPIYFSLDWDEDPSQDAVVDAYFQGVASVISLARTGVYGGYWIVKRLFDAGLVTWGWQTEAWSSDPDNLGPDDSYGDGSYLDPRAQVFQRNDAGYVTVGGVQCDLNLAQAADFGQWNYVAPVAPTPPAPPVPPAPPAPVDNGALTATQARQLSDVYGSQFNPTASLSPFATPGEGKIWNNKDLVRNDDGMLHPMYVAWAAGFGDAGALATLQTVAAITDTARASDAALAKAILARLNSTTPAQPSAIVTVPAVADDAVKPSVISLNKKSVSGGFHTIVTAVSGGSSLLAWVLANFGGELTSHQAAAISAVSVFLGTVTNLLTREDKVSTVSGRWKRLRKKGSQ